MKSARKLAVFIGSTREDLSRVRTPVIEAILNAGHIPNGMELWAAGYVPTQEAIASYLELSDIHVILLGARYGSLVGDDMSYTEWEYRQSEGRRPVVAFLLEKTEFEESLKKSDEPQEKKRKLKAFRKLLREKALCRFFKTRGPHKIAVDCVNAINEAINSGDLSDDAGWIRASSERGRQLTAVDRNIFLQRILETVHGFSTLTRRLEVEPAAKAYVGRVFWDLMLGRIKRLGYRNIFFESGSTLAFVSDEFERKLKHAEGDETEWRISTNNALVLLQLLLHTHLHVTPKPAGAPEEYYGAMLDSVLLKNPEAPPNRPRGLFTTERDAVSKTRDMLMTSDAPQLFLAAASGLDIDHEDSGFHGPHVGSHPNMLFKRAIFDSNEPVVLFLSGEKVGAPNQFKIGKCYPVFGPDFSWLSACKERKLALAIGYGLDEGEKDLGRVLSKKTEILNKVVRIEGIDEFDVDYASRESESTGAMILANKHFKSVFRKE